MIALEATTSRLEPAIVILLKCNSVKLPFKYSYLCQLIWDRLIICLRDSLCSGQQSVQKLIIAKVMRIGEYKCSSYMWHLNQFPTPSHSVKKSGRNLNHKRRRMRKSGLIFFLIWHGDCIIELTETVVTLTGPVKDETNSNTVMTREELSRTHSLLERYWQLKDPESEV